MGDKVFVAEDEEDILKLVKMILEKSGYQVVSASNGLDAELRILKELPDLALIDVVMPKKGGFEVCKALKTMKKTRHIPIIMFTVLGRDIDKKMSEYAGADGHFTKPFEPKELIEEIQKGIKKSKQDRFSRSLELSKNQLWGRKLLFEYDSKTLYERVVRDFLLEGQYNNENPVIMTHEFSALYKTMKDETGVELVPFTIPIVLSPLLDRYTGQKLRFVFDNLSDTILSTGFQSTYQLVRDALPKLAGNNVTALFLLNPESHEAREVESIRNLFRDQLEYTDKGIRKIKLS